MEVTVFYCPPFVHTLNVCRVQRYFYREEFVLGYFWYEEERQFVFVIPPKRHVSCLFVLFRLIWTFTNLDRVRSRAYTHQELQWLWFYKCNRLIKRFYFSGTKFGDMMSENLVHINPGSGACLQMEWSMVSLRLPSQQPWRLFPVWWTLPPMATMASIIECKLQQIFV